MDTASGAGALDAIRVSLVIPVRNEAESLPALFDSIEAQTCPPDDVVIVDGGSSDGTADLARRLAAADPRVCVVEPGAATPGRGRNVGIEVARHDWIALTDAGIRLEPDWLEQLLRIQRQDPTLDVVYGAYEPTTHTFFERCATLAYVPPPQERPGGRMCGPFIASTLLRKRAWREIGGFPDLRAAEDLIFMERLARAGFRAGWAPHALVHWQVQQTLSTTYRRFVLYSGHNVLADRQRLWHYGVARQYVVGAAVIGLAVLHAPWWWALLLGGGVARVLRLIWRRRGGHGMFWCLNPVQVGMVALIVLTTDAATFVGWGQAAWGARGRAVTLDGAESRDRHP